MSFMLIKEARQCRAVSKDWNDGFISTGITPSMRDPVSIIITIYDAYKEEWTDEDVSNFWIVIMFYICTILILSIVVWVNNLAANLLIVFRISLAIVTAIIIWVGCYNSLIETRYMWRRVKHKDFNCSRLFFCLQ
jgi:hypothetical protein